MAEAVRLLLRELNLGQQPTNPPAIESKSDPVIGAMREAADEMDEIVADAMRKRQTDTWRAISVE